MGRTVSLGACCTCRVAPLRGLLFSSCFAAQRPGLPGPSSRRPCVCFPSICSRSLNIFAGQYNEVNKLPPARGDGYETGKSLQNSYSFSVNVQAENEAIAPSKQRKKALALFRRRFSVMSFRAASCQWTRATRRRWPIQLLQLPSRFQSSGLFLYFFSFLRKQRERVLDVGRLPRGWNQAAVVVGLLPGLHGGRDGVGWGGPV